MFLVGYLVYTEHRWTKQCEARRGGRQTVLCGDASHLSHRKETHATPCCQGIFICEESGYVSHVLFAGVFAPNGCSHVSQSLLEPPPPSPGPTVVLPLVASDHVYVLLHIYDFQLNVYSVLSLPAWSWFFFLSTQILVDVMRKRTVKAGEWVIRQGDKGDCFFIIDKGTFEVRVNSDSNSDAVVTDEKDAGELVSSSSAGFPFHGAIGSVCCDRK